MQSRALQQVFCGVLAGGLFLIDSRLPLGVAAGVPYILVIAVAARDPSTLAVWVWAVICSFLLALGFGLSPAAGNPWHGLLNRGMGLFVIWTTAILAVQYKRSLNTQARALEELRESQASLATLQKVAKLGSWVREMASDEAHCSEEFCRLMGFDRRSVRFAEIVTRIHPDDRASFKEDTAEALAKGGSFESTFRAALPDGSERILVARGTVSTDAAGRPIRTAGTLQDITAFRQTEQALESQRTLLETLMEAWPDMVFVKDAESRFVTANAWTASKMGAKDPEDMIGKTDFDYHQKHLADDFFAAEQKLIRTRRPILSREEAVIDPNGDVLWLSSTKVPLMRDGEVVGLVGINRDITALHTARKQAELANRTKSQFLANMSHELRTPLNAIIGFSSIIKEQAMGPVGNATYVEYGADINSAGQHLLQLINDILDLSKVESGRDHLNEENICVDKLLEGIMRLLRERADEAGLKLVPDSPPQLPSLFVDERKLKQIVVNLLSNAIKFTKPGGTVTVTVRADDRVGYMLQVADTGIGIDPQHIPVALSVFGRVEEPQNRNSEGTGLGLPLTKALVEQHGGSLDIESAVGAGTTVTVVFPADRIGGRDVVPDAAAPIL